MSRTTSRELRIQQAAQWVWLGEHGATVVPSRSVKGGGFICEWRFAFGHHKETRRTFGPTFDEAVGAAMCGMYLQEVPSADGKVLAQSAEGADLDAQWADHTEGTREGMCRQ